MPTASLSDRVVDGIYSEMYGVQWDQTYFEVSFESFLPLYGKSSPKFWSTSKTKTQKGQTIRLLYAQ